MLIRKAQVLVGKLRAQPFPDPRNDLALAPARVDLPAALALLEVQGLQPYQRGTIREKIAKRFAATDPAAARRIISTIDDSRPVAARRVVFLWMAAKDLPAARA